MCARVPVAIGRYEVIDFNSVARALVRAAAAWHKKHLSHLKTQGLTPDLFRKYLDLFKKTMTDLQIPEPRTDCAAKFIEAAW
jgi:truncated hemoglobin YjbI